MVYMLIHAANMRAFRRKYFFIASMMSVLLTFGLLQISVKNMLLERVSLLGFQNDGQVNPSIDCGDHLLNTSLDVQQSFFLRDNLVEVVQSLQMYPQIDEDYQHQDLPFEDFVNTNWAELAGSGTWLPKYQVYLFVTRLIYYPSKNLEWPRISFLRGRLFDSKWNHLNGHAIPWDGEQITFPRVFDIPGIWTEGDIFLGPEDPRVVLEEDVEDAEPVIVFNMLSDLRVKRRMMWIHRPFSKFSTPLAINGEEQKMTEKNWAPFFHKTSSDGSPSQNLSLVYSFQPLQILICDLRNGQCEWQFQQNMHPDVVSVSQSARGGMRGGTNFVPIHERSSHGVYLWVGFPRTHLDEVCEKVSTYRPELVILASTGSSDFHVAYASDAIDFGGTVLDPQAIEHPCDEGHILIPNGIVRWDQRPAHDLIHLSLSVADHTIQVIRLHGVMKLVESLPIMAHVVPASNHPHLNSLSKDMRWSAAGKHVLECSVSAAMNSSIQKAMQAQRKINQTEDKAV
jgi:beta-1,2-mannosyltransferase